MLSDRLLVPGSKYPKPSEILFPDNSLTRVKGWVRVTEAIVRWLMKKNFLMAKHCPIQYQKEYILATSPTLPNGQSMKWGNEINSLYLNRTYNALKEARNARLIIEHAGQDPAQFKLRFR